MIKSIALNMITYNEAHRIEETLFLAAPHVDEIVVIDQQSNDGTFDILRNLQTVLPLKVFTDRHWGYCEPSRIKAWEHSESEWILVLDADERVSDDFVREMRKLDSRGFRGARLKRSLWLDGNHRFTGDYQYRFFHRNSVRFLKEIHTEPQPYKILDEQIFTPDYIGIWHEKSWAEQIRDEEAYENIIPTLDEGNEEVIKRKLSMNVHLAFLRDQGLTVEDIQKMTPEERLERGVDVREES